MSIEVKNITKTFGKQLALSNVSFRIDEGEIVGFLGPNGAGKSTLMKILTGYLPADSGKAFIDGLLVGYNHIDFRSKIGYLPEHNPLYLEMYIREYLLMVAGFYKIKNRSERVKEMIDMTGLTPEASKKIGALSKGYRQRVGLAQALIHNPDVLILDEPTSGLDPNQLDEIRHLITGISQNKTVMLSTHIMQEVEAICNRVIIINKGQIIADGPTAQINTISKTRAQRVLFATIENIDLQYIAQLPFVSTIEENSPNDIIVTSSQSSDIRPELFKVAVSKGWTLLSLVEQSSSVENIFRELTR
ncbi:MAG TPA: gliding motility-associated ABC transporter ATP-binding subunit GldA [Prolixibacteraceae bacterium]|nr:gliding motility-associated ABC transporter ATP-binding subunit GldA [Prolixibacteraceae bacterium]